MKFLNEIVCGDSFELIEEIEDESINLIITSPPYYNQRDYGAGIGNEEKVEQYIEKLLKVFHECVRVISSDGSIVFNIGDKYESGSLLLVPYRFALEVLDKEPVKLANNITWLKLNPTPRQFRRRLVNSTEPFFHFVRSDEYYYNLDAFMNHLDIMKRKKIKKRKVNNIGMKYFGLINQSSLSDKEKKMAKKELRNVIQEVTTGKIASFRMKIRGIHALPFGGQAGGRKTQILKKGFTIIRIHGRALKKDVIDCAVETIKGGKHPAVYPEYIITELLKLLTREDDVVLDPFIGSGTTAIACRKMNRNYIGFELNPEYCSYAEERLKEALCQKQLQLEIA